MKITTTTNQFTVTGLTPDIQYLYKITTDKSDEFIQGTLLSDNTGSSVITLGELDPAVDDWVGDIHVFDVNDIEYVTAIECVDCQNQIDVQSPKTVDTEESEEPIEEVPTETITETTEE